MSHGWRAEPFPVGPSSPEEIWASRSPNSIAVIDGDETMTTAALQAEVDRVARILVGLGLRPSGRVLWLLGNEPASVVSLLATIRAGGVWLALDRRATDAEREYVIDDANPALVLASLPEGDSVHPLPPPPEPHAIAAIAYTSGTTGGPRGVVHTVQQLLYPAAAAIETEQLSPASLVGTPLSLATLNILLLGPLTALACGGTAVMLPHTDPARLAADVRRFGITRLLVVPTIVQDLLDADIDGAALASVERMIMGGSGFDRARAAVAQTTFGVPLIASYGLSEAPTGVARMRVGASGALPLPGIDIQVEPDGEISLAPTETGPWARCWRGAVGYWGDDAAELWRDGRIHTGDRGFIDADGRLHVEGRIVDMINRGGATIAPAEVERALLAVPGVEDAAVFGIDDDRLGQQVAAAIVGRVDPGDVRAAAREVLSGYKVPATWLVVDAIPRNANGKIDRNVLRALAS